MESDDRPSIWDVRTCLLSSLDFAEDFAHIRPEHAAAVTNFSQEIRKIKRELMSSFDEGSAPSSLHDIVNGLTGARAMVSIMAERHPEERGLLTRFLDGLRHAQEEFIQQVRPDVKPLT
jgi:hypothetical protein